MMVPSEYVTLLGLDEPITEGRVASTRTYGTFVPVNVKRRCPTREAVKAKSTFVAANQYGTY